MGATGETTPGGSRREGADEAVMEALRERLACFAEKWRWFLHEPAMVGEVFTCEVMALYPEPEARPPEAARPPEPGEAPSGAPTGGELREVIEVACEHCGLPLTCNASLHEELEGVKAMIDENITERDTALRMYENSQRTVAELTKAVEWCHATHCAGATVFCKPEPDEPTTPERSEAAP